MLRAQLAPVSHLEPGSSLGPPSGSLAEPLLGASLAGIGELLFDESTEESLRGRGLLRAPRATAHLRLGQSPVLAYSLQLPIVDCLAGAPPLVAQCAACGYRDYPWQIEGAWPPKYVVPRIDPGQVPGDLHLVRLGGSPGILLASEELRDSMRELGVAGLRFTPVDHIG